MMREVRRRGPFLIGAAVVAGACLLEVTPAVSRPPTSDERVAACSARVHELETEVRALRAELRDLGRRECRVPSSSSVDPTSPPSASRGSRSNDCDPPYDFDQRGMKVFKIQCIDAASPRDCSVPFVFSAIHIKSIKPGCVDSAAPCEPPYRFENGVKIFKSECL